MKTKVRYVMRDGEKILQCIATSNDCIYVGTGHASGYYKNRKIKKWIDVPTVKEKPPRPVAQSTTVPAR